MLDHYLDLIDFRLNITEDEFGSMMSKVKHMIASKFASKGQVVILESSIRRYQHKSSSSAVNSIEPSPKGGSSSQINFLKVPDHEFGRRRSSFASLSGKRLSPVDTKGVDSGSDNKSDHSGSTGSYEILKKDAERHLTEEDIFDE